MNGVIDFEAQGTIGVNLQPKRWDVVIYKGDTFRFYMRMNNNGSPVDVSNWEVLAQIKKVSDSTPGETPALNATVGTTDGLIEVFLSGTETAALINNTEYKYDVQITDTSGNKRTFIGGRITVTEDISE